MSGELHHLIALLAAFNTRTSPDETQFPFGFIDSTSFEFRSEDATGTGKRQATVADWFHELRDRRIERLLIAVPSINTDGDPPDRMRNGFVNSVGRSLVGTGPRGERWWPSWSVGNLDAPDRRIWQLSFTGQPLGRSLDRSGAPALRPPPPIDQAHSDLMDALHAVHRFAVANELDPWPSTFARAITIGSADLVTSTHPNDRDSVQLPDGWGTPKSRRLLRTAIASDVFAGMGSWNDTGPTDHSQVEAGTERSEALYRAILHGVVAALNA